MSRLDGAPEAWAPSHRVALIVARAGRDELGHQASVRLLVAVRSGGRRCGVHVVREVVVLTRP